MQDWKSLFLTNSHKTFLNFPLHLSSSLQLISLRIENHIYCVTVSFLVTVEPFIFNSSEITIVFKTLSDFQGSPIQKQKLCFKIQNSFEYRSVMIEVRDSIFSYNSLFFLIHFGPCQKLLYFVWISSIWKFLN